MDKQDELLKEAETLARYMSGYQHELPPNISKTSPAPEEAREELLQQCEAIWKQMEECQSKLTMSGPETLPETDVQLYLLMMQVKALTAEYEQWQKRTPEIISDNQDVLGKEELEKIARELEMVLSSVQAKNKKLKKDLEKNAGKTTQPELFDMFNACKRHTAAQQNYLEQNWLDGQQKIVDALTSRQDELKNQLTAFSEKRVYQDIAGKLYKVRAHKEELLSALGDFLEEHFPLPQEQENQSKKKKGQSGKKSVQLMTLHEILEILINKLMTTPHDPYLVLKPHHWPPYIEMLLRYGIALRHPEDTKRIRLEAFHQ
ncbi:centromere protein K-like [Xenopus laevis]|uniref:Centromere protein K-like n=2 Tax=Xenopus laevis TaxID=8355 RepID=A0A1L8FEV3_XENLA|nr:centromere protein K-like [Xenopus laevis]OCT70118.1 hypothetical protein XELAEV_18037039mg [Xenopus laevis]